jgi:cellobiose-specific phosphotransferase system component IIA
MNFRHIMAALVLSLFSMGVVQAAGQPIHEDYTALLAISEKMLAAAKAKDTTAFTDAATEASAVAKDQGNKGNSPRLQRISTMIKQAKKAAKTGDFDSATTKTEEARVEMNKPDTKPTFGGTTEGGGRKGMLGEY